MFGASLLEPIEADAVPLDCVHSDRDTGLATAAPPRTRVHLVLLICLGIGHESAHLAMVPVLVPMLVAVGDMLRELKVWLRLDLVLQIVGDSTLRFLRRRRLCVCVRQCEIWLMSDAKWSIRVIRFFLHSGSIGLNPTVLGDLIL